MQHDVLTHFLINIAYIQSERAEKKTKGNNNNKNRFILFIALLLTERNTFEEKKTFAQSFFNGSNAFWLTFFLK